MSNINDTLKRINELAAKKKSGQELTPEELAEKKELYFHREPSHHSQCHLPI